MMRYISHITYECIPVVIRTGSIVLHLKTIL